MQYTISGMVVRGDGYGRKLGFPTVNINPETKKFPKAGVYSGTVLLDGIEYRAGIIISPLDKIEAHLIGYNGDAYGKSVTFKINKFLREYKRFDTEEELINQIKEDLTQC